MEQLHDHQPKRERVGDHQREADRAGAEQIYLQLAPSIGIGIALRDRQERASGHNKTKSPTSIQYLQLQCEHTLFSWPTSTVKRTQSFIKTTN